MFHKVLRASKKKDFSIELKKNSKTTAKKKRPTSVSFISKTTHAISLLILALICKYKHDFMQKNGLPKCGLVHEI
jgi:hypothetical protein